MKELTPIEILEKLDLFYNNAWNKLIILLAVVGVVTPIIINWWQSRNLRFKEKKILSELNLRIDSKIESVQKKVVDDVNVKVHAVVDEFTDMVDEKIASVDAGTYHIQANDSLKEKDYPLAIEDFIVAAYKYLKGKDQLNMGRVNRLIKDNIESLTKEELEEMEITQKEPSDYINKLEKNNINFMYSDLITSLKQSVNNIKNKEEDSQ